MARYSMSCTAALTVTLLLLPMAAAQSYERLHEKLVAFQNRLRPSGERFGKTIDKTIGTVQDPTPSNLGRILPEGRINHLIQHQTTLDVCPTTTLSQYAGTRGSGHLAAAASRTEFFPKSMSSMYPAPTFEKQPIRVHWVIISCSRQHWGRFISSTLLSGFTNELYPTTISIVWCRQYNASEVPTLLYNMRHSHQVNVFYMSPKMQAAPVSHTMKVLVSALMVPCMLGMPHLPLLFTEDDLIFAPAANARLAAAFSMMGREQLQQPFALSVYRPGDVAPAPEEQGAIPQKLDDFGDAAAAHTVAVDHMHDSYYFGSQGAVLSPGMVSLLLAENMKTVQGQQKGPIGLTDMVLWTTITEKWKCNQPGSNCNYHTMEPSLVQHTGTTSALFNAGTSGRNQRFHSARDFPVRIRFPGYDPSQDW